MTSETNPQNPLSTVLAIGAGMSATAGALGAALAKFQGEMPQEFPMEKVNFGNKSGGKTSYSFARLGVILKAATPILSKFGLCITQDIIGENLLITLLIHSSGEWKGSGYRMPMPDKGTMQDRGSIITYSRRYAIGSLLGIAPENDDDANDVSGHSDRTISERPAKAAVNVVNAAQAERLLTAVSISGISVSSITSHFRIASLKDLPASAFDTVMARLNAAVDKQATAKPTETKPTVAPVNANQEPEYFAADE